MIGHSQVYKLLLVFCILYFSLTAALSQSIYQYSGTVIDNASRDPLIGASVITDSGIGTVTDIDGYFTFSSDQEFEDIKISYIGYLNTLISVAASDDILVVLSRSEYLLDIAVITGSKFKSPLIEASTSISIVKPDLISDANIPTIDQVLDKVPGVQIQDGQANIRGGSGFSYGAGSRVLVLVDGISILQADAGRVNWNDIPVENIGQIEVLKGAASVLYGSSALNGIINIDTADPASEPITRVSASYRVFGAPTDEAAYWYEDELLPYEWNVSGLHKQKFGKIDVVASGFYARSEEVYQEAFNNRGRFTTKLKYRFTPNITAQVNTSYNATNNVAHLLWRNGTAGQYGFVANSLTENEGRRFFIDPSVSILDQFGGQHKILGRFYNVNNTSSNNRSNTSQFYVGEYQYSRELERFNGTFTGGLTASNVNSESELFSDTLVSSRNLAIYGQVEKFIGKKLKATLGARVENNVLQGPKTLNGSNLANEGRESETRSIFRAGLNYKVSDFSALRASFGQGYRFPTITEKFISTSVGAFSILPNPELQSENGWSAEIGYKQGVNIGGWRGYVDGSAFISQYEDMTEFTLAFEQGVFGFKSVNIGDTEIKGFELEVAGESELYGIPIRVIGGYTFIDPKYRNFTQEIADLSTSEENILKYRTRHNAKGDIQAQYDILVVGLSYQYASEMVAIDNLFYSFNDFVQLEAYRQVNTTAYHLFDSRIGLRFDDLSITLHGNNLLNNRIMKRPARLEPPRSVALRVDYSF